MSISNSAGQIFRFVNETQVGDYVVFPSKFDRKVNIGIIESDYYFDNGELKFYNMPFCSDNGIYNKFQEIYSNKNLIEIIFDGRYKK